MRRIVLGLLLVCACGVQAHLNHIQFAAIDEIDGKLRVRYRMSADMFMSNLDLEIAAGRMDASIKQLPIERIVAAYFQTHLRLEAQNGASSAESVSVSIDFKNGDWIADFLFPAPAQQSQTSIFCDAFLNNNPRTQTLARINW